jgi:hypothetical protein
MKMNSRYVRHIANISTKIPEIGDIVTRAYRECGKDMNIIIEHDREEMGIKIEKTDGFSIDSGYMSDAMRNLCEDGEKWEAENCHIVLLKEGIMTQVGLGNFFKSIPSDRVKDPFVFMMNPNFNPNTLRLLIDALIKNQMKYQFVFVNETKMDDIYMDVAAVTGGTVQDASAGVGDYLYEYCGFAHKITVEIDKTVFINLDKKPEVKARIKVYKDKLKKKYKLSRVDEALYTKRLGALTNGIVKIKFKTAKAAEDCVVMFNGREYNGRVVKVFYWDGKTDYDKVKETEGEMKKRIEEFGEWLENE